MSSHIPWEQVYVFVSSTFHDMHAERDYLVKRVFPELAEWCERRRLHLTDVDLRWGVTEKDAVDNQNAVKVCLHHIDACRPFFLCFLGQRRGWIPEAVSDETLETYPGVREFVGRASITELEILHAMVQPMGGDHPRGRSDESFFYLRLPTFLAQQPAEPRSIRDVYTNGGSPGEAFHDQLLSEWREEIIPSLGRPVHFYEATWNSSGSTPEIAIPLESPGASLRSEHWRRRWRDAGINLPPGTKEIPSQLVTEAVEFNRILTRGRLGTFRTADPVDESSSDGDDRGSPLSQAVLSDLKRAIDARFPGRDDVSHADPLQQELDQQDEFRFNLIQGFVERPGVFADLNRYLNDPTDRRLFVLTGEPGVGKSALLAKWVETFLFGTVDRYSERTCHMRFVGAGDRSTVVDDLMRSLLLELQQHQKIDSELPPDPEKLQRMWPDFLEQAGQHGPTVFVIDALDQLETGLGEVDWLLETLPPNVKMIISFAEGTPKAKELCARFVENRKVIVVRAEPFAGANDRRLLVDTFLWQFLKQLDDDAIEALIQLPAASNPLFLKVVLSELRYFGAFDQLQTRIRFAFGDTPVSAFDSFLGRLERDPDYTTISAQRAVPVIFGMLAHARAGLTREELTYLVVNGQTWPEECPFEIRWEQASDAVSVYLRQARQYLARRGHRFDLLYTTLRTAALARYVGDPSSDISGKRPAKVWHKSLAECFYEEAKAGSRPERIYDVRVIWNLEGDLSADYMSALMSFMTIGTPSDIDETVGARRVMQRFSELSEALGGALRIDIGKAGDLLVQARAQGSIVIARMTEPRAREIAATLMAKGLRTELEAVSSEDLPTWRSDDPRSYSELLFHQARAGMWSEQAKVLADVEFRGKVVTVLGAHAISRCFEELVVAEPRESVLGALDYLRLHMTLDEITSPFMKKLSEGFDDILQLSSFLLTCASDAPHHGNAVIALRALDTHKPRILRENDIPAVCRQQLRQSLPMLLASRDKRVRWEAVHGYWKIDPQASSEPLLQLAVSRVEHPLVRAEAARQLGGMNEAALVPKLLSLADSQLFPLCAFAARSARRIQLSLRLVEIGPIDDSSQPDQMPSDLQDVLRSLGADLSIATAPQVRMYQAVMPSRRTREARLLIHLILRSDLSVDVRWAEVAILDKIFRHLPCHLVCSEGGASDCSLTPLKKIASSETWQNVAPRFLHDLKLNAEEYLQLTTAFDYKIQGVDDMSMLVQAHDEKREGKSALQIASSVSRARTILENTLAAMTDGKHQVAVLITQELPAYQIGRLLGAGASFLMESLLPEKVPPHLIRRLPDLMYVPVQPPEPSNDVFDLDINYQHSLTMN